MEVLERAREDGRMRRVREELIGAIKGVLEVWGGDAAVSDVCSSFFLLLLLLLLLPILYFAPLSHLRLIFRVLICIIVIKRFIKSHHVAALRHDDPHHPRPTPPPARLLHHHIPKTCFGNLVDADESVAVAAESAEFWEFEKCAE